MEIIMNEKILEVTITNKNTHMRNDVQTHNSVSSHEYNSGDLTKSESQRKRDTTTVYSTTTSYDNYTITKIEATDKENKKYSSTILRDNFLPEIGDTIKVCINKNDEILAYQPYSNADPISLLKNHKFSPFSYYQWSFILYSIPFFSPFFALQALKPEKKFIDGEYKNTYIFSIIAVVIIALQIYSSYNFYKYGGSAFVSTVINSLIAGGLFVGAILLHDLREAKSKFSYISKLKKMLKS
jgi:hypothetical protein